jgi:hypothetical protein
MGTTTTHAEGTFKAESWDEGPYAEVEGAPKLTHARVTSSYDGDLQGKGTSASLMFYRDDAGATYVGYERVEGSLGGRSGSFVLEGTGSFEGGVARTTWKVVPGSGTGALRDLRGEGGYAAPSGEMAVPYWLDYDLG